MVSLITHLLRTYRRGLEDRDTELVADATWALQCEYYRLLAWNLKGEAKRLRRVLIEEGIMV